MLIVLGVKMNNGANFEIDEKFRRIRQLMTQMPVSDGISHSEFALMNIIFDNSTGDGITVSQIAEIMNITPPAVSRTLKSLDGKGLIERRANVLNRRSTIVLLTEKGVGVLNFAQENMLKMMTYVSNKMGSERVNEFNVLFGEMLKFMVDYINQKKEEKTDD